jgi:hypothetical protein
MGDGNGDGKSKKTDDWLSREKLAFQDHENSYNGMLRNETADELAFWQGLLDAGDVPAKHEIEVRRRVAELTHSLRKQEMSDAVADARAEATETAQAINAGLAERTKAINEQIKLTQDAARQHQISWQDAEQRISALIAEEVAAQKKAALDIYMARVSADDQIKSHYAENTSEFAKAVRDEQKAWQDLQDARVKADAAANQKILENHRQTVDQMRRQWAGYIDGSVQALGSGIQGMITGTRTFQGVMLDVANSILTTFIQLGERMLEHWILDLIMRKTTQGTTAVAQVGSNAAVAASAAIASTAAIPIIGPELAPAAGALAFSEAMAYAPMAIAAGGWDSVPFDNYPSLLHKEEMVLPATIASPLRAAIGSGAFGGGGAASGSGDGAGQTHHHWHIQALDARSFAQVLADNPRALQRAMAAQVGRLSSGFSRG